MLKQAVLIERPLVWPKCGKSTAGDSRSGCSLARHALLVSFLFFFIPHSAINICAGRKQGFCLAWGTLWQW